MSLITPITELLGIQHPILLAGMGQTAGAPLVAAVSNAGGLGVVGGVGYTVEMLKSIIADVKANLRDPSLPFGVDLLIPQVGGSARKTNKDYTRGTLDDLVDVIIESGAKLFVSAVGVPPKHIVDKLHANGIFYMNMIGHPKHVARACAVGCDIICAQGGEAGGHTGNIPTSILVPACADECKKYTSPLTGKPVLLVAAGGICDGRSVAAALVAGASAVWIGTRFVAAVESDAPEYAKESIIKAGYDSAIVTTVFSGRPLRAQSNPYLEDWENNRREEIKSLTAQGILPLEHDLDKLHAAGKLTEEIEHAAVLRPMGIVAGLVNKKNQKAGEIVDEIVKEAYEALTNAKTFVKSSL